MNTAASKMLAGKINDFDLSKVDGDDGGPTDSVQQYNRNSIVQYAPKDPNYRRKNEKRTRGENFQNSKAEGRNRENL